MRMVGERFVLRQRAVLFPVGRNGPGQDEMADALPAAGFEEVQGSVYIGVVKLLGCSPIAGQRRGMDDLGATARFDSGRASATTGNPAAVSPSRMWLPIKPVAPVRKI